MYYKPETNELFKNHSDIRNAHPHILFENVITDESLEYNDIFPLAGEAPITSADKTAVLISIELIDGKWTQMWEVHEATPEEMEARKPPVPQRVTRRQARQALLMKGHLDKVPFLIAAIKDPVQRGMAQIEWEDATEFDRQRPIVLQLGKDLGMTDAELDDIFRLAATL